jgi:hypothetical protein
VITFVCWKWRHPTFRARYTHHHVMVLYSMLRATMSEPFKMICVTDDPAGLDISKVRPYKLWQDHWNLQNISGRHLPSCYRRLKLFDLHTQEKMQLTKGDLLVSIDLDAIVLADLVPVLKKMEGFTFGGWKVPGAKHASVYNGSFWTFRAGAEELQFMWDLFDPQSSPALANKAGFFGSDQAWLSQQLVYTQFSTGWGREDGVLSYPREVRASRVLPPDARVVFFHGKRKPWDISAQRESQWIKRYWRLS